MAWKELFPKPNVEVTISRYGGMHRADIVTQSGMVIELQHSPISPYTIQEREAFYGRMIWLIDLVECGHRFQRFPLRTPDSICNRFEFFWKHTRPSLSWAKAPVLLDFGKSYLVRVDHLDKYGAGCGWFVPRSGLLKAWRAKDAWS